ncbi:40S ribosomal protein S29 [Platanthera guangdongensis]|uniref:40S ribosomal protein S29 n=1 Tax=Platanthera guangdongensis TaxID=2320717 RepID=A0ABR2MDE6_9ASPA
MLEGSTRDSRGWWTGSGKEKTGPGLECPDLMRSGGELMLGGGGGCNQRGRACLGVERRLWWTQWAHGWRFDEGEVAAWPEHRVCGNSHGMIRKYGLMCCRQCFRNNAKEIGFIKPLVLCFYVSSSVDLCTQTQETSTCSKTGSKAKFENPGRQEASEERGNGVLNAGLMLFPPTLKSRADTLLRWPFSPGARKQHPK